MNIPEDPDDYINAVEDQPADDSETPHALPKPHLEYMDISRLPKDILIYILSWAQGSAARHVCKRWRALIPPRKHRINDYVTRIELLQWARANNYSWNANTAYTIITYGNLTTLKWAHANGCPLFTQSAIDAARANRLSMLEWLYLMGYHGGVYTFNGAALNNNRRMIRFLRANNRPWDAQTCTSAALKGNLPLLKWLRHHGCPWDEYVFVAAIRSRNLDVMKYVDDNGCPRGSNIMNYATGLHANLDALIWMRSRGFEWTSHLCTIAAVWNELGILAWAIDNGCPVDDMIIADAANNGNIKLDTVKWLRSRGYPWHTAVCSNAAKNGRMDIIAWAYENGCPWDVHTCAYTASCGNLANLQWLRARGCPWDVKTCYNAVRCIDILSWAHENGCPWNESVFRYAVGYGTLEVYEYLKQEGCPYTLEDYQLGERRKARGWSYPV